MAGINDFCAKTLQMPSADLTVFANPNLALTELLWDDAKDPHTGAITAFGGNRLRDSSKFSQPCSDTTGKTCTNAGGSCAMFAQWETGAPVTSTPSYGLSPDLPPPRSP